MHNSVNIVLIEYLLDGILVGNIRSDKSIILPVLDILKVLKISGVCEDIHIDDADIIIILLKHVVDVVGTDESGASCDKISSHFFLLPVVIPL